MISDRNVRVSAGWVHTSGLSPFYYLYLSYALGCFVKNQWSARLDLTESISVQLYQLFEVPKNPTRETLLVTVGSMGK